MYHSNIDFSVNKVVPKAQVLATALDYARQIVQNSPDAVQSSKRALLLTKQKADVEDIVACHVRSPEGRRGFLGENIKVGNNTNNLYKQNLTFN